MMALQLVVEGHHVVAVPAHAAADVQQQLRDVGHDRRDLVGDGLGGVEVTRIQAQHVLPRVMA
jgi:predicted esterase YcpF (UPF0227 family)